MIKHQSAQRNLSIPQLSRRGGRRSLSLCLYHRILSSHRCLPSKPQTIATPIATHFRDSPPCVSFPPTPRTGSRGDSRRAHGGVRMGNEATRRESQENLGRHRVNFTGRTKKLLEPFNCWRRTVCSRWTRPAPHPPVRYRSRAGAASRK